MGLFSSSSRSTTNNTSVSASAPMQVSDHARAFNFQNIDGVSGINIDSIDPVIIDQIVGLTNRVNENTFTFADFAVDAAGKNLANSLIFGEGLFGAANSSIINAMESSAALSNNVLSFTNTQLDNTREFSAGAIGAVTSFAKQALDSNLFASSEAMGYIDKVHENSNDFAALALLSVNDSAERSAAFAGEAFTASFEAVDKARQSEASQLSEKVLYAAIGLAAIAAFARFT